jgi:type IV pilus assembly protein PilW
MKRSILKNKQQKGFSLIELMIAMTIGLFLLAGIASSYLASKKASVNRSSTSELEDNGRFALEAITRSLQHTGYSPNIFLGNPFINNITDVTSVSCPNGSNSVQTSLSPNPFKKVADGSGSNADTIGIVFLGDNNIFTDCAGSIMAAAVLPAIGCRLPVFPAVSATPESSKIYNSLYIDAGALMCIGSQTPLPVTIAEGVENMQILYGVDTDSDGAVEGYVSATSINSSASLSWEGVISIQVAVLVRTLKPIKNQAESEKFRLLDTDITTVSDRFQRAVFSTTIFLHNTI